MIGKFKHKILPSDMPLKIGKFMLKIGKFNIMTKATQSRFLHINNLSRKII